MSDQQSLQLSVLFLPATNRCKCTCL